MIIEIESEKDLDFLEENLRSLLCASRFDVSVLKSMPYIKFRLQCLKKTVIQNDSIYFANENVWIKVLTNDPIVVYCGLKELYNDDIKFRHQND